MNYKEKPVDELLKDKDKYDLFISHKINDAIMEADKKRENDSAKETK